MTKSLGQVAYEAYLADQLTRLDQSGHSLDDWSETGDHDAWQSAAEAVAVKVLREQPNVIIADHELHPDAKQAIMENTRKHNAVIEAAKALHEAWMEEWDPSDPRLHPVHVRFKLAVDEMLTVEGDYCKGHASAGVDARVVTIDDAGNAVCPTCRKPKGDAERAVLEAAKAYKHGWHNGQNMDVLRDALFEALQGVE